MVPMAHAGDGGGSIRVPSSHCNLFGLKPARGRVSLGPDEAEGWAGLIMRHVLAHSVRDSAAALDVLQGYMTGDWYTAPPPARPYLDEVGANVGQLRVGVRTRAPLDIAVVDPECAAAVANAARLLESLGHTVEEATPAALDEPTMMEVFTAVMFTALRADLAELGEQIGRPITSEDVEAGTWGTFEAGAGIDGASYVRALTKMHAWNRRMAAWWEDDGYDVLLTPTCAEPPPLLGDLIDPAAGTARQLPFAMFTAPFNVTGQPAMSVPLHWSDTGSSVLPIGVQLVAATGREDLLLRLAAQLEAARPWADRRPPVHA
jgi:amidase